MQAKSVEPGTHSGVARFFGSIFLFQAGASLFLGLSEQTYEGYFSLYLAVMCVICVVVAVGSCIPAAVVVAVPEPNKHTRRAIAYVLAISNVLLSSFFFSSQLNATPDIPYINRLLRRELLGAIIGAIFVLGVACLVRMARRLKGRNGAYILLSGLVLIVVFGLLWAYLEPLCRMASPQDEWPSSCPMPQMLDHNFMMTLFIVIANVLTAEGVLRLMAAGTGVEDYVEIIPIITTT
eukprot:TRINITY_DN476_c0_g1_i1.p1 TRINITY_DN476_c0_g1~~TRINITY_DN476_c0_g1_i1.p1  ORF type:complete len:236 (+),score=36.85 TRINITY_DN476_c0_g1_i1:373-1080(+)